MTRCLIGAKRAPAVHRPAQRHLTTQQHIPEELTQALRGLARSPGRCFCEQGTGNPVVSGHSDACERAGLSAGSGRLPTGSGWNNASQPDSTK